MRAPLSIVIPTLNAADELPATLLALLEGLHAGLIRELIVSDGGSTDATADVAQEAGATFIIGPASRGGQLNRGAAAAEGSHLLLLHADTHLSPGWSAVVREALDDARASERAGYFRLAFRSPRPAARIVAGWANLRSRVFGLPYGDQGLLVPRSLLTDLGGVPDQPLMEDVALARILRGRLKRLDATATTSFQRYERDGVIIRGTRNFGLLMRYLSGAHSGDLAARYHR